MTRKKLNRIVKLGGRIALLVCVSFFSTISFVSFHWYQTRDVSVLLEAPFAHRGMYDVGIPENSLAAFQNAINNGCAIELDVRITKDDVPVVFHDGNTARNTNANYTIKKTNYSVLAGLKLEGTNETIPTLAQALELINDQVPVLVDVKASLLDNLSAILQVLTAYQGRVAVQAISPLACRYFARRLPEVPVGMLFSSLGINTKTFLQFRDNLFNLIASPSFVSYDHVVIEKMNMNKHRANGLVVLGYTLNLSELTNPQYANYFDNFIFGNK